MRKKGSRNRNSDGFTYSLDIVSVYRKASKSLHFFSLLLGRGQIKNHRAHVQKILICFVALKGNLHLVTQSLQRDYRCLQLTSLLARTVPYTMKLCLAKCKRLSSPSHFYIHYCVLYIYSITTHSGPRDMKAKLPSPRCTVQSTKYTVQSTKYKLCNVQQAASL